MTDPEYTLVLEKKVHRKYGILTRGSLIKRENSDGVACLVVSLSK